MPLLLRNALALLAGLVVGSAVNMALVAAGAALFPLPAGADPRDPASLAQAMLQAQPQHFLMPWLAHALGTLAGALTAWWLAGSHPARFAYAVGGLFLLGGVAAARMIPAPTWFIAADLLLAYLPMAWLAAWLGRRLRPAG